MTPKDVANHLVCYNLWRRGDVVVTCPDPSTLGKVLELAVMYLLSIDDKEENKDGI